MSIDNKAIDYDEILDAHPIRRSLATAIDILIVFFIRAIVAQILAALWISERLLQLSEDYKNFFGTEVIDSADKAVFIQSHPVFGEFIMFLMIILFIGSLYYAYFHSSKYRATIGKRIMSVELLNSDYSKLSFAKAFLCYYFSLLPLVYATYIMTYTYSHKMNLFNAMFANLYNGLFTVTILALAAFFSSGLRRHMGSDLVLQVVYLNHKTNYKFPWSKEEKNA